MGLPDLGTSVDCVVAVDPDWSPDLRPAFVPERRRLDRDAGDFGIQIAFNAGVTANPTVFPPLRSDSSV